MLGSIRIAVRIGLRKKRITPAATAPTTDPTPPASAMPPRTTAATLLSVALAAFVNRGSPVAVIAVIARPARPANAPATAYAVDLGPPDVHAGQIRRVVIAARPRRARAPPRPPQPDADDGHRQRQREQRGSRSWCRPPNPSP